MLLGNASAGLWLDPLAAYSRRGCLKPCVPFETWLVHQDWYLQHHGPCWVEVGREMVKDALTGIP
jgi:hypothetical protein